MKLILTAALTVSTSLVGCITSDFGDFSEDPSENEGAIAYGAPAASCPALMSVFPVEGAHNIGYDAACGGAGGCPVSCDGSRANSDYGPGGSSGFHHGIDVFAHRGAVLRAVAPGRVVYAKVDSVNGSNEVKIQDACGWSYFYGHLESFAVKTGDMVMAGQQVGTMGNSGTGGVHLHFNASPGAYKDDIDPLQLLKATAPTACGGAPSQPTTLPPPPPSTPGCGTLAPGEGLGDNTMRASCDGRFILVMQGDGNLVLYPTANVTPTGAVWNSRTFGATPTLWMQTDGNLVVYHGQTAVWNSRTHGNPGATLEITNAGKLRVRSASNATLWTN